VRPQRIQRKRTKGWKMPPNTVYVGRQSKWGNYTAGKSAASFKEWVCNEASSVWKDAAIRNLRGKNLACWCRLDQPCHADVLLDLMAGGVHKALSSRSGESDPLVTMGYTPPAAT